MVAVLLIMLAAVVSSSGVEMQRLVPKEVAGWIATGEDRTFDRKSVFDYLDGGAEVYLAYDFRRLFTRHFVKPGQGRVIADVFDMGSSKDAFGIFSFEREGKDVGIGRDSEYAAGLLRFWKGTYFVAVTAERETPSSRSAAISLGRAIAAAISASGERPDLLAALPGGNLMPLSVRYFHQASSLNYHYFVADQNILNLSKRTEAVIARYAVKGGKPCILLLVRYPDAAAARGARRKFVAAYMPEAGSKGITRTENGRWTAARCEGRVVVAVFDSPAERGARSLLDAAVARLQRRIK
jgi:hypothetical protein